MKILLVDDEWLAIDELRYLIESYDACYDIKEATSIEEALSLLVQYSFDVVFLDIHLHNESGMTLAKTINKMPNPPKIIFATAYDEYAIKAFEQNAVDYLLKPYHQQRLNQALERIKHLRSNETVEVVKYPKTHPIELEDRIYMVHTSDIMMIEAQQKMTKVYTQQQAYQTSMTLNEWQKRLDPQQFMRTHRSFIVNISSVIAIEPWFNQTLQLTLPSRLKAPVSRPNVKEVKQRLGI